MARVRTSAPTQLSSFSTVLSDSICLLLLWEANDCSQKGQLASVTEYLWLRKPILPKVNGTFSIQIWYFHLLLFGSTGSEPTRTNAAESPWAPLKLSHTATEWISASNFSYVLTHMQFLPILKRACLIFPNLYVSHSLNESLLGAFCWAMTCDRFLIYDL